MAQSLYCPKSFLRVNFQSIVIVATKTGNIKKKKKKRHYKSCPLNINCLSNTEGINWYHFVEMVWQYCHIHGAILATSKYALTIFLAALFCVIKISWKQIMLWMEYGVTEFMARPVDIPCLQYTKWRIFAALHKVYVPYDIYDNLKFWSLLPFAIEISHDFNHTLYIYFFQKYKSYVNWKNIFFILFRIFSKKFKHLVEMCHNGNTAGFYYCKNDIFSFVCICTDILRLRTGLGLWLYF